MLPIKNPPHLEFEAGFWYDCANTYNEERKQHVYAAHMGLTVDHGWPFGYKVSGRVLDIGGGPVSLLLKATGYETAKVQDPTNYPAWVYARYLDHGIAVSRTPAEKHLADLESEAWISPSSFDEVWLYNCLQHTEDPVRILANATSYLMPHGGKFRFFEWINIPPHQGHPHMITAEMFDPIRQLAKIQQVHIGSVNVDGCYGEIISGWVQL